MIEDAFSAEKIVNIHLCISPIHDKMHIAAALQYSNQFINFCQSVYKYERT